jgi:ribosomal protein L21E
MDRKRAAMLKALDKGGIVVVEADGSQITTYPMKKRKGRLGHA